MIRPVTMRHGCSGPRAGGGLSRHEPVPADNLTYGVKAWAGQLSAGPGLSPGPAGIADDICIFSIFASHQGGASRSQQREKHFTFKRISRWCGLLSK
jgi:hypothetical protein